MSRLIGKFGESCAAEYLKGKGYDVLKMNYYSKYGEIDIIASNQEYIVFVEVKTRKVGSLVKGVEYVNRAKQRKIIMTCFDYIQHNYVNLQIRFDVIEVEFKSIDRMYVKRHIENAFIVEGEQYAFF